MPFSQKMKEMFPMNEIERDLDEIENYLTGKNEDISRTLRKLSSTNSIQTKRYPSNSELKLKNTYEKAKLSIKKFLRHL